MSQAISINSTRLLNFNYDFANCCVTIATMALNISEGHRGIGARTGAKSRYNLAKTVITGKKWKN